MKFEKEWAEYLRLGQLIQEKNKKLTRMVIVLSTRIKPPMVKKIDTKKKKK